MPSRFLPLVRLRSADWMDGLLLRTSQLLVIQNDIPAAQQQTRDDWPMMDLRAQLTEGPASGPV